MKLSKHVLSVVASAHLFALGSVVFAADGEEPVRHLKKVEVVRGEEADLMMLSMGRVEANEGDGPVRIGMEHTRADAIKCKAPVVADPQAVCTIVQPEGDLGLAGPSATKLHRTLINHGARVPVTRVGISITQANNVKCSRVVHPRYHAVCTFETDRFATDFTTNDLNLDTIAFVSSVFTEAGLTTPVGSNCLFPTRNAVVSRHVNEDQATVWSVNFDGKSVVMSEENGARFAEMFKAANVAGFAGAATEAMFSLGNETCSQNMGQMVFYAEVREEL